MNRSAGDTVGTIVTLGVVGGLLYLWFRALGFTGGRGRTEIVQHKDLARLAFLMTGPAAGSSSAAASFVSKDDGRNYSLEALIERVKSGGRSDVSLKIRGDVRSGAVDEARAAIEQAGIVIYE